MAQQAHGSAPAPPVGAAPAAAAGAHGGAGAAPKPAAVVRFSDYPWTTVIVSEHHDAREAHRDVRAMPPGWQPSMEDKCGGFELANPLPADGGGTLTCLYVVDGHAGAQAATYVRDNFQRVFCAKLARQVQPPPAPQPSLCAALYDAVLELEFLLRVHSVPAGAVAAFTVLRVNGAGSLRKLYVANVGDVEVVLVDRARAAVTLTKKHTPANPDELARLTAISCSLNAEGGPSFVSKGRLVGDAGYNLAITRTLGDFGCKPWATAEPSMASCALDESFAFFYIASDGVFDCEFGVGGRTSLRAAPRCGRWLSHLPRATHAPRLGRGAGRRGSERPRGGAREPAGGCAGAAQQGAAPRGPAPQHARQCQRHCVLFQEARGGVRAGPFAALAGHRRHNSRTHSLDNSKQCNRMQSYKSSTGGWAQRVQKQGNSRRPSFQSAAAVAVAAAC
jgi:serine/threonine protein phosphatase PrpC